MATLAFSFLIESFFIFSGNEDMYKCSNELEFLPDPTIDDGVICP